LNNKIDLEIRILDGILKLLTAICKSTIIDSSSSNSTVNSLHLLNYQQQYYNDSTTSPPTATSITSTATSLISKLNNLKDFTQCTAAGVEIANAIINTTTSNSNNINSNNTNSTETLINDYNQIVRLLNAYKCLFVSHRKLTIYFKNLYEIENEKTKIVEMNKSIDTIYDNKENSSDNDITSFKTAKLAFSDLRIPLSWKWNDYIKASKNSGKLKLIYFVFINENSFYFFF
jgi:hypothetical protein